MQANRLLPRILLLFLITICFTLALHPTTQNINNKKEQQQKPILNREFSTLLQREKRATNHKPGFFKTLFSVIYEQWSDTKNTINKVNELVNDNFLPENAPITQATTASSNPNITTTAAPTKIKRSELNRILQRNLRGLVRLFNIELQDALKQSDNNYIQYRKNASLEVSKFL